MKKLKHPNSDGWWLWFERGCGSKGERILVSSKGLIVASDDEWEVAMGRKPEEVYCENYWEGTDTTQRFMPGSWQKI